MNVAVSECNNFAMVLSLDRFRGKIAIVTGASSGIGAAIAQKLVEEGVIVAGLARRSELIEDLSKKLSSAKGKLHAVKADLTKENDILEAFKWVTTNLGPVSILVNNAGVLAEDGALINGKTESWQKVLDTNVLGLCIATREAIKSMTENKIDGHIIHINSVVGHMCLAQGQIYGPSKYAVTALTETLRQELNHQGLKIKVSSLSPGLVKTELPPQEFLTNMPYIDPEDIANGVVYMLSTPPHVQVHELMIRPVGEKF